MRMARGEFIQAQCNVADLQRDVLPGERDHRCKVDVFIMMSGGRLGGGREYRFRQAVGQFEPCRQGNAANRLRGLVVLETRAAEIAAHHGLQRQRTQAFDDHRAPQKLPAFERIGDEVLDAQIG